MKIDVKALRLMEKLRESRKGFSKYMRSIFATKYDFTIFSVSKLLLPRFEIGLLFHSMGNKLWFSFFQVQNSVF